MDQDPERPEPVVRRDCEGWMAEALAAWRSERRPEALGELLKAQRNRAYSVALRITASPAEAEDAVQDAFIKLLSRTHGFEDLETFELSVYRAVVQCALDAVRKTRRRKAHETPLETGTFATGEGHVSAVQRNEPSELEQQEATVLLRQAVAELSEDERAPVVLCYYQGLSVVQTAKTLEVPRETIRARLERAMTRLRQVLKKNNKEMSAALIVALLWRDGNLAAPATLCSALDKALPGKACHAVTAPAHAGPAQVAVAGAAKTGVGLTALISASILAAVLIGTVAVWNHHVTANEFKPAVPAALADSGASSLDGEAHRSQPGLAETNNKEDDPVKSKVAALVLAGGMMLPTALQAAEPNAQVADAIAQIAARRAEKDAAAATSATSRAQGEANENRGWNTKGGFAPGASAPRAQNPGVNSRP